MEIEQDSTKILDHFDIEHKITVINKNIKSRQKYQHLTILGEHFIPIPTVYHT